MRLLGQFIIFFMIKFHKHKKEYKTLKSTISLRFIDLKMRLLGQFIFFMIKFHKHKKEYKALKAQSI